MEIVTVRGALPITVVDHQLKDVDAGKIGNEGRIHRARARSGPRCYRWAGSGNQCRSADSVASVGAGAIQLHQGTGLTTWLGPAFATGIEYEVEMSR